MQIFIETEVIYFTYFRVLDKGFSDVPGMLEFWPLNIQYEGQNVMSNGGDFALTNVQYNDDDGIWKSPPAYFPPDGIGYFSSSEFNFRQQDFSWMTAYKQEAASWGGATAFTLSFGGL